METMYTFAYNCKACGYPADGFIFGCDSCEFFLHHQCAFLPPTVKHHHRHVLALTYSFPEESHQEYCDVCEEEAGPPPLHLEYWRAERGKEKQKHTSECKQSLYYYYCKICDYIAHVFCVTQATKMLEEEKKEAQLEHFSHQHPLRFSRKAKDFQSYCSACNLPVWDLNYYCVKCNFVLHKSCAEFPPSIKHQLHEHSLTLGTTAPCDDSGPAMCNYCDDKIYGFNFHCADCTFSLHVVCARTFLHPSHDHNLRFGLEPPYSTGMFRCDACGELGQGFGMHCTLNCNFDLHLECFTLPGSVNHECHPHRLSLASSLTLVSDKSHCDSCDKEADPELWIYYCEECKYVAHLSCVSSDLLRARQASDIRPNFCTILSGEETSIKVPEMPPLCFYLSRDESLPLRPHIPLFVSPDALKLLANENDDEQPTQPNITDLAIKQTNDEENSTMSAHWSSSKFRHCGHQHTPTLFDEPLDEVYCIVCNLLIFPPAYSCAQCQIFLHKSCAELPHNYPIHQDHIFTLGPAPFGNGLSKCSFCKKPISSFSYLCATCGVILDVQCAFGVPIMKHKHHKHCFFCTRSRSLMCRACGNPITGEDDAPSYNCGQVGCESLLHVECALLPYTITHRIHRRHSLALTWDLDASDEFYCDVCENEVNPKLWAYHCDDCDASAHVPCVTSRKCISQHRVDGQGMS